MDRIVDQGWSACWTVELLNRNEIGEKIYNTLRLHGMSWGVKTTCFKAPQVSLGGSGVSIGGVRILRACLILWKNSGFSYFRTTSTFSFASPLADKEFTNLQTTQGDITKKNLAAWCHVFFSLTAGVSARFHKRNFTGELPFRKIRF